MKRVLSGLFLAILLAACSGPSAPGGGSCREGICIKIRPVEPLIYNAPITVMISVTTETSILKLGIALDVDQSVMVDPVVGKPPDSMVWSEPGLLEWEYTTEPKTPIIIFRTLSFPDNSRDYNIKASAITKQGMIIQDSFYIDLKQGEVKIYLRNTPLPKRSPQYLEPYVGTPLPKLPTDTPIIYVTPNLLTQTPIATATIPAYPAPQTASPTQRIRTPTAASSGTPGYPAP